MVDKSKLIGKMFEKGILVSEDFIKKLDEGKSVEEITNDENILMLNAKLNSNPLKEEKQKKEEEDDFLKELKELKDNLDNKKELVEEPTTTSTKKLEDPREEKDNVVEIIQSHDYDPCKHTVKDFTNIFVDRFKFIEKLLSTRRELNNILTINRINGKKERESTSLIGMVKEIGTTKTGHIIMTVEDLTGEIKVLFSKNNKELHKICQEITLDEIVGIKGTSGDKIIFAETIVWPDIPKTKELKKSEKEEYALFLSDIHVGSDLFLKEPFKKFINWINGKVGNDSQKELAKKTKYLFVAGDLVDGIGIYPSQEEELHITDIKKQYEEFVRLIKQISPDKKIIVCPGNHDIIHLAEPQRKFYPEYAQCIYDLPNVTVITNPGTINIGKTKHFSGFNVLMYHGYSFDYYISNISSIRNQGGYNRADLVMKFLLKRRHLAPTFKSTPYYPGLVKDPLVIRNIPDFFLTGHIHYSKVANYRGVTMICGSCWQAKTSFQEKLGHEPEPARVPIVNLKTRKVKVLKFV